MRRRAVRRARGFTLIEVLVALTIGAMVLLGARALLEALAEHAAAVNRTARLGDANANAEHAARGLLRSVKLGAQDVPTFIGSTTEARFTSWCSVPTGWAEPCRVFLSVKPRGDAVAVVLALSTGERLIIRDSVPVARLEYLLSAEGGGRWTTAWTNELDVPLAVAVLTTRDTILMRIGQLR